MPLILAIDGPVGAGKSTLSDEAARRLRIPHLDTGAMYRAVGLAAVREHIDTKDEEAVTALLQRGIQVDVDLSGSTQRTILDGEDVSDAIRTQAIGQAASDVSRYAAVREAMVALQRRLAQNNDMLLDGRDIGTRVLPDAQVKIYLTADAEVRALRRLRQMEALGKPGDFETVLREVNARDLQDTTRALDPLRKAEDAVTLDSSNLSFEETVQAILRIVEQKTGHAEKE